MKNRKKLLLLGGLRYQIPVIKAAHDIGLYVITCDNVPGNIAHKYSDKYYNISIIDNEKVLQLAKDLEIDGIMSFAVDPGVITAAYVCEKLGLPSCGPYKSVEILQNKALFREFLTQNNFNVPKAKGYKKIEDALADDNFFKWPVIVKPVDSAGSKGVSKVNNVTELDKAIETAINNSFSKSFILEEFIEKKGYSSDTDCFSVNGELLFCSFSNQYFDSESLNPFTPAAYSWPSYISSKNQEYLKRELQRLVDLLDLGTSIYNIEVCEDTDGKAYIMEVSPRGGGNRLAEMLKYSTGTDLIEYSVLAAIGEDIIDLQQSNCDYFWAEIILHSKEYGKFIYLHINDEFQKFIYEVDLWVEKGDIVRGFNGANDAIGILVLKFDNQKQMDKILATQNDWLKVKVEKNK